MNLHSIVLEPHATPLREIWGLRNLRDSQQTRIKLTRRILLTSRHCELNVVDPVDVHLFSNRAQNCVGISAIVPAVKPLIANQDTAAPA